jgi:hypothetical protein
MPIEQYWGRDFEGDIPSCTMVLVRFRLVPERFIAKRGWNRLWRSGNNSLIQQTMCPYYPAKLPSVAQSPFALLHSYCEEGGQDRHELDEGNYLCICDPCQK